MFSKADFIDYFAELSALEREMIYTLMDQLQFVEDSRIRDILSAVLEDECRHYSLLKELLDEIFLKNESQKSQGIGAIGAVKASRVGAQTKEKGFLVHECKGSYYLEFECPFKIGEEVELSLFDEDGKLKKKVLGKVVWFHKVKNGLFMTRIHQKGFS